MFMMLKNKVAIVTGGTRGIGFAVVKKFIEKRCGCFSMGVTSGNG